MNRKQTIIKPQIKKKKKRNSNPFGVFSASEIPNWVSAILKIGMHCAVFTECSGAKAYKAT
jgi:hypothetical protein